MYLFKTLSTLTSHLSFFPPNECVNTKEFIRENLIRNNATEIELCYPPGSKERLVKNNGHAILDTMINQVCYAAHDPTQLFFHEASLRPYDQNNFPFERVIEQSDIGTDGHPIVVPVYLNATILSSHVGRPRDASIPSSIYSYLNRVGRIPG